jgi:hypothetical protein
MIKMSDARQKYIETGEDAGVISFLKESLNVTNDQAVEMLNNAKEDVEKIFPNATDKPLRIWNMLNVIHKAAFNTAGISVMFEGVLIFAPEPRDIWANQKQKTAGIIRDAVKNDAVDMLVTKKIIALNKITINDVIQNSEQLITEFLDDRIAIKDKKLVFLMPALKADNTPSQMAGRPIVTTLMQNCFGFGTEEGKDIPQMFELTLQNEAINENIKNVIGKPVRFMAQMTSNTGMYKLKSNKKINFVVNPNSETAKAIDKYDLISLLEKFMPTSTVTLTELNSHVADTKAEFSKWLGLKNFVIIKDALVTRLDFNPSGKSNSIKIHIADEKGGFTDSDSMCLYPAEQGDDITFLEGSKVAVIVKPWLGDDNRNVGQKKIVLNAQMFLPYKGYMYGKTDAPEIKEAQAVKEDRLKDLL